MGRSDISPGTWAGLIVGGLACALVVAIVAVPSGDDDKAKEGQDPVTASPVDAAAPLPPPPPASGAYASGGRPGEGPQESRGQGVRFTRFPENSLPHRFIERSIRIA